MKIDRNIIESIADMIRRYLWFPAAVFIAHAIAAFGFDAYARFPSLDIPMHFLGGLAIAYLFSGALAALENRNVISRLDRFAQPVLIFSLTCTAALFWEYAEWLSDHMLGSASQIGLDDTMLDTVCGMLGGSTWIAGRILFAKRNAKKRPARGLLEVGKEPGILDRLSDMGNLGNMAAEACPACVQDTALSSQSNVRRSPDFIRRENSG